MFVGSGLAAKRRSGLAAGLVEPWYLPPALKVASVWVLSGGEKGDLSRS